MGASTIGAVTLLILQPSLILVAKRGDLLKGKFMENMDSLRPEDKVNVKIFGPDNTCVYQSTSTGYHNLRGAVDAAISEGNIGLNPEDCVFEVTNESRGVAHKYRLNAHGHLKLII